MEVMGDVVALLRPEDRACWAPKSAAMMTRKTSNPRFAIRVGQVIAVFLPVTISILAPYSPARLPAFWPRSRPRPLIEHIQGKAPRQDFVMKRSHIVLAASSFSRFPQLQDFELASFVTEGLPGQAI